METLLAPPGLLVVPPSDSNNNIGVGLVGVGKGDKYSLRPRSLKKRAETELRRQQALQQQQAQQQAQAALAATVAADPGTGAVVPEEAVNAGGRAAKGRASRPKQKPAPLSKYRRKTANARERSRMREINVAFETLRRAVPHIAAPACANEKLTKITTLRLAMKYIAALTHAVKNNSELILEPDALHIPDKRYRPAPSEPSLSPLQYGGASLNATDCSELSYAPSDLSRDRDHSLTPPVYAGGAETVLTATVFSDPLQGQSPLVLPNFDNLRMAKCASSCSNSLSPLPGPSLGGLHSSAFSEHSLTPQDFRESSLTPPDFSDHPLLGTDFSDFPDPTLGIADLVDPCLSSVGFTDHSLSSDDFYESAFATDFS